MIHLEKILPCASRPCNAWGRLNKIYIYIYIHKNEDLKTVVKCILCIVKPLFLGLL